MTKKIIGFLINIIAAGYIVFLGIEFRESNNTLYLTSILIAIILLISGISNLAAGLSKKKEN